MNGHGRANYTDRLAKRMVCPKCGATNAPGKRVQIHIQANGDTTCEHCQYTGAGKNFLPKKEEK
jgi:RNase P subunit RPR2